MLTRSAALFFTTLLFAVPALSEPLIQFDKESIHGVKVDGEPEPFFFEIKNIGDEDLNIESVHPSCGCTDVTVQDKVVRPGKTTRIEGSYAPNPDLDEYNIKILVNTNAANTPSKVLLITGRNKPEGFKLSPTSVTFTSIEGSAVSPELIHLSVGEGQLKIIDFSVIQDPDLDSSEDQFFNVVEHDLSRSKNAEPGDRLALRVSPKSIQKHGAYKGTLDLSVAVDGEAFRYKLPLTLKVVPDFEFAPPLVKLPPFDMVSSSRDYRIRVKSQSGLDFTVKDVTLESDAVRVKTKRVKPDTWFIYLDVAPDKDLFSHGAEVSVVLNESETSQDKKIVFEIIPSP